MKYEKEVKILGINVEQTRGKLMEIGANFIGKKEQKIYVYDIPTLYYRYCEILELLKSSNTLLVNTNIEKLRILLNEFVDLVPDEELFQLAKDLEMDNICDIINLPVSEMLCKLENPVFSEKISSYMINSNKWIRLRESNNKIELTVKHIFEKTNSNQQVVQEREVNTSSFEETNCILESIGIVKRSYQEKIRYSFQFGEANIEIDFWPRLSPYMEIECDNENTIKDIIDRLELTNNRIVSMNVEQLYKEVGIDLQKTPVLKF